jgi:hypothetical protein
MHLPRQVANDGKTLVAVDMCDIRHKPAAMVRRVDLDALQARVNELEGLWVSEIRQVRLRAAMRLGGSRRRSLSINSFRGPCATPRSNRPRDLKYSRLLCRASRFDSRNASE